MALFVYFLYNYKRLILAEIQAENMLEADAILKSQGTDPAKRKDIGCYNATFYYKAHYEDYQQNICSH